MQVIKKSVRGDEAVVLCHDGQQYHIAVQAVGPGGTCYRAEPVGTDRGWAFRSYQANVSELWGMNFPLRPDPCGIVCDMVEGLLRMTLR